MIKGNLFLKIVPALSLAAAVVVSLVVPGSAGGDLTEDSFNEYSLQSGNQAESYLIDTSLNDYDKESFHDEAAISSENEVVNFYDDTKLSDEAGETTKEPSESIKNEADQTDMSGESYEKEETVSSPETSQPEKEDSEADYPETLPPETQDELMGLTAVARVEKWVNVRLEPTTESGIIGKIYNNCAATIIDEVDGEGGSWYLITSGNVNGYIKSEYFVIGDEAEQLKSEIGLTFARVIVENLRVRSTPDLTTDENIITMYPMGTEVFVVSHDDEWALIQTDAVSTGYVHVSCIEMWTEFDVAITLQEEEEREAAKAAAEEAARIAQEEYEKLLKQQQENANQNTQETTPPQTPEETTPAVPETSPVVPESPAVTEPETTPPVPDSVVTDSDVSAALRNAIVSFALQFEGCPYVHGGRSLSQGTDCSGFTNLIYQNFGYTLDWTPAGQADLGTRIDYHDVQPGDLLFYSNSYKYLGHVALYIGNGKIIHAASEQYGICIWDMNYREPLFGVRIIN